MSFNQSHASCRLPFLNKWSPDNHFWGLNAKSDSVSLNQGAFSCCSGDGLIVLPESPRDAKLCGLSLRWSLYVQVINYWRELYNSQDLSIFGCSQTGFSQTGGASKSERELSRSCLQMFFSGSLEKFLRADRGEILDLKTLRQKFMNGPGAIYPAEASNIVFSRFAWIVAATLSWHYGIVCLVARVGGGGKKSATLPLLQWQRTMEKHPGARVIVLIDGVSELWNANRLEALEGLIAFASERTLPVWLFEGELEASVFGGEPQQTTPPVGGRSFKAGINQRLTQLKSKSGISWLSAQALSRLSELCHIPAASKQDDVIPAFV